jgi:hypothetical protein
MYVGNVLSGAYYEYQYSSKYYVLKPNVAHVYKAVFLYFRRR